MGRDPAHRRIQPIRVTSVQREFDVARPSDDVYAGLMDDIERGILTPGEHLVEVAICTRFGVSRTPVRNAIKRLETEGLVTSEPNRGAFVASWTSDDAAEVMAIRSMLEPHAAALAAQRRTTQDLEELRALCQQMERLEHERPAGFRDTLAQQNYQLHLKLLEIARSPRLFGICKNLTQAPLMAGSFHFYDDDQLRRSLSEHREIVTSIELKDAETARASMNTHLRLAYQFMTTRRTGGRSEQGRAS